MMEEIWDFMRKQSGVVKRYIPKPLEAAKLTPENVAEVAKWCGGEVFYKDADGNEIEADGSTLSVGSVGEHLGTADMGDYIIRTLEGNFYSVMGEAFERLYEQIWWDEPKG